MRERRKRRRRNRTMLRRRRKRRRARKMSHETIDIFSTMIGRSQEKKVKRTRQRTRRKRPQRARLRVRRRQSQRMMMESGDMTNISSFLRRSRGQRHPECHVSVRLGTNVGRRTTAGIISERVKVQSRGNRSRRKRVGRSLQSLGTRRIHGMIAGRRRRTTPQRTTPVGTAKMIGAGRMITSGAALLAKAEKANPKASPRIVDTATTTTIVAGVTIGEMPEEKVARKEVASAAELMRIGVREAGITAMTTEGEAGMIAAIAAVAAVVATATMTEMNHLLDRAAVVSPDTLR